MEPSAFRARLWYQPPATATKPVLGGDVGLTPRVRSPCNEGTVSLQPETAVAARRDVDELRVGSGDVALPVVIISPRDDGPVALQPKAVVPARSNGNEPCVGRGTPLWSY